MTDTGYTDERAEPHEQAAVAFCTTLHGRGYVDGDHWHDIVGIELLPPEGHRPDIRIIAGGQTVYIDVKTRSDGQQRIAIKAPQYDDQLETWPGTLHVWNVDGIWRVADHDWIEAHRERDAAGAPVVREPTGNGSRTPFFLVRAPETAPLFPFGHFALR